MKKTTIAALVLAPAVLLTSCTVTRTAVYPGYRGDYVYSTGYYGVRPYLGVRAIDFRFNNVGYWRGYRGWNRGWVGYRW